MAIRITRVYTRAGDRGLTSLVGGKRVPKDSPRIDSYGTIDELNAAVGLARAFNAEQPPSPARDRVEHILRRVQNELFDLGAELASPPGTVRSGRPRIGAKEVRAIERLIDQCLRDLEPLRSFVLPGGGKVSAFLHQCRTVCRRAERDIVRLSHMEEVGEWPLRYVNRLGDLFFVLARWVGKQYGETELLWKRGLQPADRGKRER